LEALAQQAEVDIKALSKCTPSRTRNQVLVNSFLAKLALGETAWRSSTCPDAELERYNRVWFDEVLSAIEQLEHLRKADPETIKNLIAQRLDNSSPVFRVRVCNGLDNFLYKRSKDIPHQFPLLELLGLPAALVCAKTLGERREALNKIISAEELGYAKAREDTIKLMPLTDVVLTGGSHSPSNQLAWDQFMDWCYDHDGLTALGWSYFAPIEEVTERMNAKVKENLSGAYRDVWYAAKLEARIKNLPKLLEILAQTWGTMFAAVTLAHLARTFGKTRCSVEPVHDLIQSTKTLSRLYFSHEAMLCWPEKNRDKPDSWLDYWLTYRPIKNWVKNRALELANTPEFGAELNEWVNEEAVGEKRVEAGRRIRHWLKNPDESLDVTGLNLTTVPRSFVLLTEFFARRITSIRGPAMRLGRLDRPAEAEDLLSVLRFARIKYPFY
jgi:hypothetical protein